MRIFHENFFLPMLISSKLISFRLLYSQTISSVGDNYCKCLFYSPIVVWQEKTLSFQTLPSLISNVRLPAGCQCWCRSRGCVCRLCLLDTPVVFGCGVLNHGSPFVFEETNTYKKYPSIFYSPSLSPLSLPAPYYTCMHTHSHIPKALTPLPTPLRSLRLPPCWCCA